MSALFRTALSLLALLCLAVPARAELTDWMRPQQMDRYVDRQMNGGKAYPVDIRCGVSRGKVHVRMDVVPFDGSPPFHRWQWLVVETSDLAAAIDRIRLHSRPDLKYRIHRSMQVTNDGTQRTCALLYR